MRRALLTIATAALATAQNEWINIGGAQEITNSAAAGIAFFTSTILPLVLFLAWGAWAGWRLAMHRTVFEVIANPALAPLVAYMVFWFTVVYVIPHVSPNLYAVYESAKKAAGRGFFPTG